LLDPSAIEPVYVEERIALEQEWNENWRALCIGRDVLKAYHAEQVGKLTAYEVFRNRVAREIRNLNRVPEAITRVMAAVTAGLPSGQQ
jgi:hypothetical protein